MGRTFKVFYGKSVGPESIAFEDNETFLRQAALLPDESELCVHCEQQKILDLCEHLWDYRIPQTHSLARPALAEVEAIKEACELLSLRDDLTLRITHLSSNEGLIEAIKLKEKYKIRVKTDLTYHHALLDEGYYLVKGHDLKCNPPVRSLMHTEKLRQGLMIGCFDNLISDHAPHSITKKKSITPSSGCGSYNGGALGRIIELTNYASGALSNIINASSLNTKPEWKIKEGNPAKIMILDLRCMQVKIDYLRSFAKHVNVWLGEELPFVKTIINGEQVINNVR